MSIATVVAAIVDELRAVPGLAHAHTAPPEQINEWPALVVYPGNGYARLNTHSDGNRGTTLAQHTLIIELHVPLKGEPEQYETLLGFADSVPRAVFAAFAGDRMGGTVVSLGDYRQGGASAPLRWEQGASEWGGIQTRVMRFTLDVAVEEGIYL